MPGGEDDTPGPADDWEDPAPTILTGVPLDAVVDAPVADEITRPRDLLPVMAEAREIGKDEGFRRGFNSCREEMIELLHSAFRIFEQPGAAADEIEAWIASRLPPI